ncbi:MAG TPA: hypothetical protein VM529_25200 [Gemmata sp.]|jgi:hypothetical protein|nr:hypothetical protein [Gemmata sp.]
MYHAVGLLQAQSDFDLDTAGERLVARIPGSTSERGGDTITVSKGDWWIAVALESGNHLRDEIEGLTSKLAGIEPAEAEEYVQSARRVTVWTDVPDPFMEHFNDYLSAVEVLKSFGGVLAVDPKEPGVL